MPLYSTKEIWTPLKLIGIKFFKTRDEVAWRNNITKEAVRKKASLGSEGLK